MNDSKRNMAPFDEGFYQTGTVDRPSHGGLVAILLVAIVLLGGIITILGLLNVRLFTALQNQEKDALQLENIDASVEAETLSGTQPELSMELQEAQAEAEDMTPQQIYTNCVDSMVSIRNGSAEGTGMVLSNNGYILVDCTLVQDARELSVELADQRCLTAQVIGTDPLTNLAVLYVDAHLNAPIFGDSGDLTVGDTVITIGDPLGSRYDGTLSNSTVSSVTDKAIGTDAPWHHAGPLLDRFGQVIGIRVNGSEYAIPTATVKLIAEQLVGQGYVSGRPGLGIRWESVPELHQKYYTLPAGLYVTSVEVENALSVGDILVSLNGKPVTCEDELLTALQHFRVGESVTLEIYRDDVLHTVTVNITEARG